MAIFTGTALAIVGAGALIGTGAGVGLSQSGDEITNKTKKISYQTSNTNKISNFSFNEAVFEKNSSFSIDDKLNSSPSFNSKQEDNLSQEDKGNSLNMLIIAGVGIGALYLVTRGGK